MGNNCCVQKYTAKNIHVTIDKQYKKYVKMNKYSKNKHLYIHFTPVICYQVIYLPADWSSLESDGLVFEG